MNEIQPDGREGVRCPDCDSVLQAVQIDGEPLLRCPWARAGQKANRRFAVAQIYCDRPLIGPRSTTGMYSVANTGQ